MANLISLLPENVANQIAAGEVVQRPASVVKELLENSIDAGAEEIRLIIRDAGKSLIQVIDNGSGMNLFDARMCFERHATSKLKNISDLFSLHTKGFRGEALASIAAVAQVELKTRRTEELIGQCIQIEGGKFTGQSECQTQKGSSLSVKNLFFNIPARRNFLKEDSTELRHIIDEFERVALSHPSVHFILNSNHNEIFNLPVSTLIKRIMGIFGNQMNQKLVPVEQNTALVRISGYAGTPSTVKKKRGEQYFFVNNRFIKSPYLNHAVYEAYRELIAGDAHPAWFIFLELDPKQIDINIHPTKTEIKFLDEKAIYSILHSSVKRALGKADLGPSMDFETEAIFNTNSPVNEIPRQPAIRYNPGFNPFKQSSISKQDTTVQKQNKQEWEKLFEGFHKQDPQPLTDQPLENEISQATDLKRESVHFKTFQILGKYIISSFGPNLVCIDQQRAHERVLYEFYLQASRNKPVASQQLLFPVHFELSSNDFLLASNLLDAFHSLGFDLSVFGKNNLVVNSMPAGLSDIQVQPTLEGILESYKLNTLDKKTDIRDNLSRSVAKNTCIRHGKILEEQEMQALVTSLLSCSEPMYSPSGKPVIMEVSREEIDRYFKK